MQQAEGRMHAVCATAAGFVARSRPMARPRSLTNTTRCSHKFSHKAPLPYSQGSALREGEARHALVREGDMGRPAAAAHSSSYDLVRPSAASCMSHGFGASEHASAYLLLLVCRGMRGGFMDL